MLISLQKEAKRIMCWFFFFVVDCTLVMFYIRTRFLFIGDNVSWYFFYNIDFKPYENQISNHNFPKTNNNKNMTKQNKSQSKDTKIKFIVIALGMSVIELSVWYLKYDFSFKCVVVVVVDFSTTIFIICFKNISERHNKIKQNKMNAYQHNRNNWSAIYRLQTK